MRRDGKDAAETKNFKPPDRELWSVFRGTGIPEGSLCCLQPRPLPAPALPSAPTSGDCPAGPGLGGVLLSLPPSAGGRHRLHALGLTSPSVPRFLPNGIESLRTKLRVSPRSGGTAWPEKGAPLPLEWGTAFPTCFREPRPQCQCARLQQEVLPLLRGRLSAHEATRLSRTGLPTPRGTLRIPGVSHPCGDLPPEDPVFASPVA